MPNARDIADFLQLSLSGRNVPVREIASLRSARTGAMVFASRFDKRIAAALNEVAGVFAIVTPEFSGKLTCAHVLVSRPRLAFAQAASNFFQRESPTGIAKTAVIGREVTLGADVTIGDYCVIGDGVRIGEATRLLHHVVIGENCTIGSHCFIKSHTVIGEDGFGFERNESGVPVKLPHHGRVVVGDHVQLGNFNSVDRATLDETVIEKHVKTDDHVHIGHNSVVGECSLLTACTEISGSVRIGRAVWIGPNSAVNDSVTIGDNAFVGIGSVVTKDVPAGTRVAGNPARRLNTSS